MMMNSGKTNKIMGKEVAKPQILQANKIMNDGDKWTVRIMVKTHGIRPGIGDLSVLSSNTEIHIQVIRQTVQNIV